LINFYHIFIKFSYFGLFLILFWLRYLWFQGILFDLICFVFLEGTDLFFLLCSFLNFFLGYLLSNWSIFCFWFELLFIILFLFEYLWRLICMQGLNDVIIYPIFFRFLVGLVWFFNYLFIQVISVHLTQSCRYLRVLLLFLEYLFF